MSLCKVKKEVLAFYGSLEHPNWRARIWPKEELISFT